MKKIFFYLFFLVASVCFSQDFLSENRLSVIWGSGQVPRGSNLTNTWYTLYPRTPIAGNGITISGTAPTYTISSTGGGTLGGRGVGQRVAVWSGTSLVSSYAPFIYDTTSKIVQIGDGNPVFSSTRRLNIVNSTGTSGVTMVISDSVPDHISGLGMYETTSLFSTLIRQNTLSAGVYQGTSINRAGTTRLTNGNQTSTVAGIVLQGLPIYGLAGSTNTTMGFRHDSTGFRIDQMQNLHTQNVHALEVNGSLKYVYGTPGVGKSLVDDGTGVGIVTWGTSAGTQTLSVSSNSLTISGGNTVVLPTTTVTGTSNQITVSGSVTSPTLSIATGYVGQTSITTLGVVSTGTITNTAIITPPGVYTNSVSSNTITLNGHNTYQEVDSTASSVTTLTVSYSNIPVGATVIWNYMKTTASNCVITFPTNTLVSRSCNGITVAGSPTLELVSTSSGDFLIWITRMNGGRYIVTCAQNTQ